LFSADKNSIKHTTMRVLLFQKIAPGIPLPPQPVLTLWKTWLDAVNYYTEYYEKIMEVIDALDSTDSSAVAADFSENSVSLLADESFGHVPAAVVVVIDFHRPDCLHSHCRYCRLYWFVLQFHWTEGYRDVYCFPRFLATGMSFRSLAFAFRMGKTTVASIVKDTTQAIWDLLKEECLPFPDERMWRSIADNLHLKTNFPNCIGSIDGKHIRIKCPNDSGSDYFNYKHYYSIVLQAVVADADCKFVAVDVGCKVRQSDGVVFRSSKSFELLETNRLNIPPPTELPNSLIKVPFVLVGDKAYPLLTYLMRPFPRKSLDNSKHVFKYRLSRCRQKIECAFGILTAKWQILRKAIETSPETAVAIVRAACVLHNYVIINDGIDSHSLNLEHQNTDPKVLNRKSRNAYSITAKSIRYKFTEYFNRKEGTLPWQKDYALPANVLHNAT
ncbi:hypothetical protein ANN_03314, partial [Periplaneta americana]